MSRIAKNLALLALSLLVALVLAEGVLRVAAPRYEYAAASVHERDAGRLITREPGTRYTRPHPDTGRRHAVIHNNLALRQHRNLAVHKPPGTLRVGVFGDSFTENPRLAVPYAFTEVLDYLLNASGGPPVEVLNFGVDGYATDQAWLYYQSAPAARDLDLVLYVFAANDVRGLYENDLLRLGPDGEIVRQPAPAVAWWMPLVSRLYLTYLAIDVRNRIALWRGRSEEGEFYDPLEARVLEHMRDARDRRTRDATSEAIADDFKEGVVGRRSGPWVELLQRIVDTWSREVRARGGRFCVVLLPRAKEGLAEPLFEGQRVVNLWRAFEAAGVDEQAWRFRHDGHWNELGNRLAAVVLYRELAPELGLETLSPAALEHALDVYYAVFDEAWQPPGQPPLQVDPERAEALRRHYLALEREPTGRAAGGGDGRGEGRP